MKKIWTNALLVLICTCFLSSALPAEELRAGEAAIFMQGGNVNIGVIGDISRTRLVLQLKDGREFPLGRIWMINFVNTDWNFPNERTMMQKDENTIFLRNNDITVGRIIDLSSTRMVLELDTKEEIPIGRIRRIYMTRQLPAVYEARLKEEEAAKRPIFAGVYRGEIRLASGEVRTVILTLNENKTALVRFEYPKGMQPRTQGGSWMENADGTVTVQITFPGRIRRPGEGPLVFKWENGELVAIQYDATLWGTGGLRLRKT